MAKSKRLLWVLGLCVIAAWTMGCALTRQLTPITPTPVPETATPIPEPSDTPQPPPTTAPPTPTPEMPTETAPPPAPTPPPPTSTPGPTRIQFEPGATSATVIGHVEPNEMDRYVLSASAGQTMGVHITSPANDVLLTIVGADGIPLKRYVDDMTEWEGTLYASQDYFIEAISFGADTDYTLSVSISPLGPAPQRIKFDPGTTTAIVQGSLSAGTADEYVLRALAGQRMVVWIGSPGQNMMLEVQGDDGQILVSPLDGDFAAIASLPLTQDYVIRAISIGEDTDYTLQVSVPPAGEQPPRIAFEPGTISATVTGQLDQAGDYVTYVLQASAGQTMEISVLAQPVGIWVEGADGSAWHKRYGVNALTASLPATQNYLITLFAPPGAGATPYTMDVKIPPP